MSNNSLTQNSQNTVKSRNGIPGFIVGSIIIHVLTLAGFAYYNFKDEEKKESTSPTIAREKLDVVMVEEQKATLPEKAPEKIEVTPITPSAPSTHSISSTEKTTEKPTQAPPTELPATPIEEKPLPAKKGMVPTFPTSKPVSRKGVASKKSSNSISPNPILKSVAAKSLSETPVTQKTIDPDDTANDSKLLKESSESESKLTSLPISSDKSASDSVSDASSETLDEQVTKNDEAHAPVLRLKPAAENSNEPINKESKTNAKTESVNFDDLDKEVENEHLTSIQDLKVPSKNTQETSGEAGPIRTLSQFKQVQNNPRPQYSKEERLQGQQGVVIFHAFIGEDGIPRDFKLVKSTGFRNLDKKSLQTLKEWKFEPGQEGWVELPFSWNLKGDPQPLSRPLRTGNSSISSTQ